MKSHVALQPYLHIGSKPAWYAEREVCRHGKSIVLCDVNTKVQVKWSLQLSIDLVLQVVLLVSFKVTKPQIDGLHFSWNTFDVHCLRFAPPSKNAVSANIKHSRYFH